jgi:hypothetical protein
MHHALPRLIEWVFGRDTALLIFGWAAIVGSPFVLIYFLFEFPESPAGRAWIPAAAWKDRALMVRILNDRAQHLPERELTWGRWLAAILISGLVLFAGICMVRSVAGRTDEERAVAAIERLGGVLTRDENAPNRPIVKVSFRGAPSVRVSRPLADADPADLRPHLEALQTLRELELLNTGITDQWLTHVKGLTHLKSLRLGTELGAHDLDPQHITHAGVEDLRKALPKTEVLLLDRDSVITNFILQRLGKYVRPSAAAPTCPATKPGG